MAYHSIMLSLRLHYAVLQCRNRSAIAAHSEPAAKMPATIGTPMSKEKSRPAAIEPGAAPPRPMPMTRPVTTCTNLGRESGSENRVKANDAGIGAKPGRSSDETQLVEIGLTLAEP